MTNATRITARPQRSEDVPGTLALTFLSHRSEHPDAAAALADLQALVAERDSIVASAKVKSEALWREVHALRADVARLREALGLFAIVGGPTISEDATYYMSGRDILAARAAVFASRAALAATADNRSAQGGE